MNLTLLRAPFRVIIAVLIGVGVFVGTGEEPAHAYVVTSTVTFHNNVSSLGNLYILQSASTPTALDSIASTGFSNPNFYFENWSTQPNGGGTAYPDQATYSFSADIDLYAQWVQISHSVVFYRNLSAADNINASETNNTVSNLTSLATLGFTDPNFTFTGWSTQRQGGATTYPDQSSYPFTADVSLYAQWAPNPHTVTFFRNATSTDTSQATETGTAASDLTSLATLGFTDPNFTFTGWNTKRDGTGLTYSDQALLPFTGDVTLYGQWSAQVVHVSFESNSGSGSVAGLNSTYGGSITLPTDSSLSKAGFTLKGWNTNPQGTGTEYAPGSTLNVTGSETLYAQWSSVTYVVSFADPGARGRDPSITDVDGGTIRLPSSVGLTKSGYTFAGWFTSATGGRFLGRATASYLPTGSLTVFAHWTRDPLVRLEFSNNGGAGRVGPRQGIAGVSVVIPGALSLHRSGFVFRGWASSPRATRPSVRIGSRMTVVHTTTLYALWRRQLPPSTPQVMLGSVGIFAANSSALTPTMRKLISSLARDADRRGCTTLVLYGYATSSDASRSAVALSQQRATAVENQMNADLVILNDVGVSVRAQGEGRLANSVLASFRNVEVFAN